MTWTEIGDALLKALVFLGGGAVVIGGLAGYVAKIIADRTIEGRKAELTKQVEEKKAELAMEVERLKGELAKDTETHKLKLRKAEGLFGKEIDAASNFVVLRQQIYPQHSHPRTNAVQQTSAAGSPVARNASVSDVASSGE